MYRCGANALSGDKRYNRPMKALIPLWIVCTLAEAPALAQCVAPLNDVRIPNGNKTTMEEMVAANHAIQENTTEVEAYWQCLKAEQTAKIDAIGPDITDDQKAKIASEYLNRHNAEADKLQNLADRYDAAERSFRTKQAAAASTEEDNQEAAAVNEAERDAAEQARRSGLAQSPEEQAGGPVMSRGESASDSQHASAEKARRDAANRKASEAAETPVVPH
jgi:hypothetical protein